ncbi:MAG: dimethylsulfonioproprionate lyase family protein [Thermomicrobiales bacterium]
MTMESFELDRLLAAQRAGGDLYHEFLRVPDLNCGIYVLPAGRPDPQQPHDEDEVYYVISGSGRFMAGDEDVPARPGSIIYVEAGAEHRFHSITEDLTILVFFAAGSTREE